MDEKNQKWWVSIPPQSVKYFAFSAGAFFMLILLFILFNYLVMPWYVGLGDSISVPEVRKMSILEATRILEQQGLNVKISATSFNKDIPKDIVVSQLPYPNSSVKKGRRIYLTVSKGTETTQMPNLVGQSVRDAKIALMRLGLELQNTIFLATDSIPSGTIFSQNIPAGSAINYIEKIEVKVSQGALVKYTVVPSLLKLTLTEAKQLLEAKNLKLGLVRNIKDGTFLPNTIISQVPAVGDSVETGTEVNLTISQ